VFSQVLSDLAFFLLNVNFKLLFRELGEKKPQYNDCKYLLKHQKIEAYCDIK
jgi:hypothetical protein